MLQMANIVEFHFVIGKNFLEYTNCKTLKDLYDVIKTARVFAAYHETDGVSSEHIHVITQDSHHSRGQKIQNFISKINCND